MKIGGSTDLYLAELNGETAFRNTRAVVCETSKTFFASFFVAMDKFDVYKFLGLTLEAVKVSSLNNCRNSTAPRLAFTLGMHLPKKTRHKKKNMYIKHNKTQRNVEEIHPPTVSNLQSILLMAPANQSGNFDQRCS